MRVLCFTDKGVSYMWSTCTDGRGVSPVCQRTKRQSYVAFPTSVRGGVSCRTFHYLFWTLTLGGQKRRNLSDVEEPTMTSRTVLVLKREETASTQRYVCLVSPGVPLGSERLGVSFCDNECHDLRLITSYWYYFPQ